VVGRIIKESRDQELRALGISALSGSTSSLALETLLEVCGAGKSILGWRRLPEASREILAALRVLAERWSEDERAMEVVDAAAKSKDPAIRGAVRRGGQAP
jgi:hypothetical protein